MSSANEFREFARECMDWAKTARTEHERSIFLQMAETWLDAAMRLEPEAETLIDKVAVDGVGNADDQPMSRRNSDSGTP
jgi:hypothetical protein